MRLILLQLFKDLRDMLATHTAILILVTPVALSAVLNRTTHRDDLRKVKLAIHAPQDSGLRRNLELSETVYLIDVAGDDDGRALVQQRQANAYLDVPEGFDKQLQGKEYPRLNVLVDEAFPTQKELLRATLRHATSLEAGQDLAADIRTTPVGNAVVGASVNLLSLWILFAVISSLAVSASSMVEEKEAGTLQQILVTPATLPQVILGKVGAGSVLAGVSALIVFAWNAPEGASWGSVILLLGTGVVAFSSAGTLVGLLAEGAAAANAWTGVIFLGLFVPVSLAETSRWMRSIAVFSPSYYLYDGLQQSLVAGVPPSGLLLQLGVLGLFTVVVVGASSYKLRKLSL